MSLGESGQQVTGTRIRVRGLVQGVGFRPTVWRLAREQNLTGQVLNDGQGVLIEAFGQRTQLDAFISSLAEQCPPLARIDSIEQEPLQKTGTGDFAIVASHQGHVQTGIVADAATCPDCLDDISDPQNRRYRYPFTNCTHCGPRLSIIRAIPYDRSNTSMSAFELCANCRNEYETASDRRFHAQPNACPHCGPHVWLEPQKPDSGEDDIAVTARLIEQGAIIAIKGISGFHLACHATRENTVMRLRQRKQRPAKPFALMARNLDIIRRYCAVNPQEAELLQSTAAPIVLLRKTAQLDLANAVAPGQNTLGFMLPSTPLHHLLLQDIDYPLIMTSANRADSPQCIDNDEAREKLAGIADYWLLNNRDILNREDDSITVVVAGKSRRLRSARGYAPDTLPLPPGFATTPELVACGAELKNSFCLVKNGQAIISQHIGDLKNADTYSDYEKAQSLYQSLYQHQPTTWVVDAHPDYLSSRYGQQQAEQNHCSLVRVQHHHAHIAACLADNQWPLNQGRVIGIALDGIGYGENGQICGGELLLADYASSRHLGGLQAVALPGGTKAMQQPWRNTWAQLQQHFDFDRLMQDYGDLELLQWLQQQPLATLKTMLDKNLNSPLASSCGRLFDAVAAALGLCRDEIRFEGQAAMALEAEVTPALLNSEQAQAYAFSITQKPQSALQIATAPLWQQLLKDLRSQVPTGKMASRFHLGLVNVLTEAVRILDRQTPEFTSNTIALSGGVFQNRILLEQLVLKLQNAGYTVLSHSRIPANDGGLALGQATVALARQITQQENNACV